METGILVGAELGGETAMMDGKEGVVCESSPLILCREHPLFLRLSCERTLGSLEEAVLALGLGCSDLGVLVSCLPALFARSRDGPVSSHYQS